MPKSSKSLVYVDNFDQGLRTDVSADKAPQGSLVKAENLRWIQGGGFYLRRGNKQVTAWAPETGARIDNLKVMEELGVMLVQSGTKLFQASSKSAPLYSVGVVLTAGYSLDMREYNSQVHVSNGQDNYMVVTFGRVRTQFTNASASIVMDPGYTDLFRIPKTGAVTADASTDAFTASAHGLSNGDRVAFTNSGGALPGGVSSATEYFVRNVSANTFQVSATPTGSVLDVTSAGTGTHTFTDGILYCKGKLITYTKKKTATFTAEATTDTLTSAAHALRNGDIIQVTNSGGALPGGLSAATDYYVIDATTDTFKLSTTYYGSAVNLTDSGTGTHTFNAISGGDTFAGTVTIPSGTYEAESIVTQVQDVPTAPKATVLESVFEKMMASGVNPATHVIYYTETVDPSTPENAYDYTPSANRELFGKFGRVTAMRTLLTKMYVAKDRGIEVWTDIDTDGIPVRQPFTDAFGVVSQKTMVQMADRLCFQANQRRYKTIEPDTTGVNPQPVINPYFDAKIEGTLKLLDEDQDGACMGYGERDMLLRSTALFDSVRKTLMYDAPTKNWSIDTGISPNCWEEYRGSVFWGSATTDKIYEAETEFKDGSAGGVAVNPRLDALTPLHYIGDRRRMAHVGHLYLTGLIKKTTLGQVLVYCDGKLEKSFQLNGSADYVSKTQARPLGREYLGLDPLGFGGEDPVAGFTFAIGLDVNKMARNVQIEFICQGDGHGLQIDSYDIVEGDEESSSDTQSDLY